MPIERLPLVLPVTAVVRTEPEGNDANEDSERKRPEHLAIAEEYSRAGGLLTEMARAPLPLNVVAAIVASTKVTISPEGQQAAAADAHVLDKGGRSADTKPVQLYLQTRDLK